MWYKWVVISIILLLFGCGCASFAQGHRKTTVTIGSPFIISVEDDARDDYSATTSIPSLEQLFSSESDSTSTAESSIDGDSESGNTE